MKDAISSDMNIYNSRPGANERSNSRGRTSDRSSGNGQANENSLYRAAGLTVNETERLRGKLDNFNYF